MNRNHKSNMLTLFALLLLFFNHTNASPSPPITALFAFGDSTMDPGNNNYIPTLFHSNHSPYGKDFPTKVPTGRFSDGKLPTDFLVSSLGLKPALPAYLDPSVRPVDLLSGVSFASAGTGLDDKSTDLSLTLRMDTQFRYFEEAAVKMKNVVGDAEANRVIKNALFFTSVGTNDMVYNVYDRPLGILKSVSGYQDGLLSKIEGFIQRLYNAGARRIVVAGLPPIGCLPVQVTVRSILPSPIMFQRACVEQQNADSGLYNSELEALTLRLRERLSGSKVLYLDIYSPIMDMVLNPAKYGFDETLRGCCGTGMVEMGPLCESLSPTCPDASKYLFFDAVHPTQKAYSVIAQTASANLLPLL